MGITMGQGWGSRQVPWNLGLAEVLGSILRVFLARTGTHFAGKRLGKAGSGQQTPRTAAKVNHC